MNNNHAQLTVYKASAGSGKTFTLAREYMTLVIDNPQAYRTILAVTFTNKATEEMKTRILAQLYGIHHRLPASESYLQQIAASLPHLSEAQIVKNAGEALSLLIHNYNYFRVETIDSFFQSVLRNLARELDLAANLRVGLNDDEIEQQAVDQLIEELSATDHVLGWILEYIRENMEQDKTWNVIGEIKTFGACIFKDFYKDHAQQLSECMDRRGFFENYRSTLRKKKAEAEDRLKAYADAFFEALEGSGFSVDDLSNRSGGVAGYFIKIRQGKYSAKDLLGARVKAGLESPEKWVKVKEAVAGNALFECVQSRLHPLLLKAEGERPALLRTITSVDLTLANLNQLRLLSSIDRKVKAINEEAGRFLLSDTQNLLHALIQDSDSPFIFEKIGTQLSHVMIDEFQDTSTKQWKNFKVLLAETMSREQAGNLIVGDVKQSIYRWRSGDWRLLAGIKEQFPSPAQTIDIQTLDTNYRSMRNIVYFNNAFFTAAAKEESLELQQAYADVVQQVPGSKDAVGYVRVELLAANKEADDEDTPSEVMMRKTYDTVAELVAAGVKTSEIAILVRGNATIKQLADYFMAQPTPYPLVSDEAFRLDASQAVNTIITALHLLTHPKDQIAKATLEKFVDTYMNNDNDVCKSSEEASPVDELMDRREEWLCIPMYELVEQIYTRFHLHTIPQMQAQNAYICAFYDHLNKYLTENAADIDTFLQLWDSSIRRKSIHSTQADGIRLVTIHKSKGLEFDNVIIPYCDWKLEKTSGARLWCTPTEEPYAQLPLVPVEYKKDLMQESIYAEAYCQEHEQNMVDNLNLLYVAFTRASRRLFVYGRKPNGEDTNKRSYIIGRILPEVKDRLVSLADEQDTKADRRIALEGIAPTNQDQPKTKKKAEGEENEAEEPIRFEYGDFVLTPYTPDGGSGAVAAEDNRVKKPTGKSQEAKTNIFDVRPQARAVDISVSTRMPEFRQSNKSRDFIEGDEDEEQQKAYIKTGTVLHNLFATIRTTDDIDAALSQMELDGLLYDENVSRQRIEQMIRRRLSSEKVRDWFSHRWTLFNECTILSVEKGKVREHRPDRVMTDGKQMIVVDFKFGKPQPEHHQQVQGYMSLLRDMGYDHISGYLWYVYPNRIEEVLTPHS